MALKHTLGRRGFTLFESILYIAIVSIFLVSVSYLVIDLIGSQTKSVTYEDTTYYLNLVIDQVARDVRRSNDIVSLDSQTLVLGVNSGTVTYHFDTFNSVLTRQVNSEAITPLADETMSITGQFSNQSFMNRSSVVGVELLISTLNPGGRNEGTSTSSASVAFELRGRR